MRHMHKPKQFEKYILMIAGAYRKPSDVPDRVRWNAVDCFNCIKINTIS